MARDACVKKACLGKVKITFSYYTYKICIPTLLLADLRKKNKTILFLMVNQRKT